MLKKNKKIYIIKKQKSNLLKTIKVAFNVELIFIFLLIILIFTIYKKPGISIYLSIVLILCITCINTYFLAKLIYLYKIKNRYNIKLNRIKLKYNKYLIHHKYNFSENDYNKIYEFDSINKLVSASNKFRKKIYYFEITPGEKCFFLLEANDNLYKYILNK